LHVSTTLVFDSSDKNELLFVRNIDDLEKVVAVRISIEGCKQAKDESEYLKLEFNHYFTLWANVLIVHGLNVMGYA